jgi:hypothetical protein
MGALLLIILGIIGLSFLTVGLVLWDALVFIKLWEWFMTPFLGLFDIAPITLTYPIAIGLTLVAGMMQYNPYRDPEEKWYLGTIRSAMKPLFFLFVGWIVHLFM